MKNALVGFLTIAVFLMAAGLTGCVRKKDRTIVVEKEPPWPPVGVQDGNLVALHALSPPLEDHYCVTCHGDMTNRTALDPRILMAHSLHKKMINFKCTGCHRKIDLLNHSGAKLRRQVDPEVVCDGCHGEKGVGKQLYQK